MVFIYLSMKSDDIELLITVAMITLTGFHSFTQLFFYFLKEYVSVGHEHVKVNFFILKLIKNTKS